VIVLFSLLILRVPRYALKSLPLFRGFALPRTCVFANVTIQTSSCFSYPEGFYFAGALHPYVFLLPLAQLILESPREVYSLAFAPHKEELLVGGLSNGQIVIWDIQGKIERVETEIKLTPAQIRHNLAMVSKDAQKPCGESKVTRFYPL